MKHCSVCVAHVGIKFDHFKVCKFENLQVQCIGVLVLERDTVSPCLQ